MFTKWPYFILCIIFLFRSLDACTAFHLKSNDGAYIYCRSMEFGLQLDSQILVVPRGTAFNGTAPGGKTGLKWTATYGYAGMNQSMAPTLLSDGMNEKGLVVGSLYLPGFADYQKPDPAQTDCTMGSWELTSYLLGTCATLSDVRAALPKVLVANQPTPTLGNFVLPLHFYVSDKTGAVLVIEYVNGICYIDDNPLGVLTNSPPFQWHLINLSNYVNLSPINANPLTLGNMEIRNLGQGTGLLGLPGDYSPPSRFVRAAFFSKWASPQATAIDSVKLGFHILNTFDIFTGIIRSNNEKHSPENTQWIIVHDQTNLSTYFRMYDSLRIQKIDFSSFNFAEPGLKKICIDRAFKVEDISKAAERMNS